jgi:hypothetical protein
MLLAEDLLLLLTDDRTGKLVVNKTHVDVALGGAQLIDLSLAHRADLDERKRLVVLDGSPTGDRLLDGALSILRSYVGKKPRSTIRELSKGLRPRLYDRLVNAGFLRAEHGKVLGLFATTSWPATSVEHESVVRRNLVGQLVQGLTPDPRTAALVALLHALRCTHKVVVPAEHGLGRRELDRRAKQLAEGSWGSQAVRQTIDAMTAAVAASVAGSAAVASSGG